MCLVIAVGDILGNAYEEIKALESIRDDGGKANSIGYMDLALKNFKNAVKALEEGTDIELW